MEQFGCCRQKKVPTLLLFVIAITIFASLLASAAPVSLPEHPHLPQTKHQRVHQDASHQGGQIIIHDSNNDAGITDTEAGRSVIWSRFERSRKPVKHDTQTAILLTNGQQIKLYPLKENDLSPSGGYYVIKSMEQFNLSDSRVIETLEQGSTFTQWLKYKQSRIQLKLSGNLTNTHPAKSSILPHQPRKKLGYPQSLDEDELFTSDNPSGWRRPHISDVDYLLDDRFCNSGEEGDCLVVFWIDKQNKYLRYGSHQFTDSNQIQLLSSRFDAHGNLRSLSDENKKTIWLHEFPPVDLCKQVRMYDDSVEECTPHTLVVNRDQKAIHISLSQDEALRYVPQDFVTDLDNHNISLQFHIKGDERMRPLKHSKRAIVQCAFYWFGSNNELYSLDPFSELASTNLVEKLSNKPAVKMMDDLQARRDILFFNDLATRSIMSYNVTRRSEIRRQSEHHAKNGTSKGKISIIKRLEPTHSVLIVEPSTIESFSIINFNSNPQDIIHECASRQAEIMEPRVIDDDLSEHITRQRIDIDCDGNLLHDVLGITFIVLVAILILLFTSRRRNQVEKSGSAI